MMIATDDLPYMHVLTTALSTRSAARPRAPAWAARPCARWSPSCSGCRPSYGSPSCCSRSQASSLSQAPFHRLPFTGSLSQAPFHRLPFTGSLSQAPFHRLLWIAFLLLPFTGKLNPRSGKINYTRSRRKWADAWQFAEELELQRYKTKLRRAARRATRHDKVQYQRLKVEDPLMTSDCV
jgi:hypothetical protein